MKRAELNNEMVSLNSEFSEFNLQKLEERLETDPLAIGGLLDVSSSMNDDFTSDLARCTEYSCGIDIF